MDIEQIEKFFNLFQEEIKKIVDYEQIEIPEDKIVSGFVDIKKENSEIFHCKFIQIMIFYKKSKNYIFII